MNTETDIMKLVDATAKYPQLAEIVKRLNEIDLLVAVLDRIIRESKAQGDERWKESVAPQVDALYEERDRLIKEGRDLQGREPIPPVSISVMVGSTRARGKHNG